MRTLGGTGSWLSRCLVAGAVVIAIAGCGSSTAGSAAQPPPVPVGVRFEANLSLDHVTIRWTVPSTPSEFDVEWKSAGGEWRSLGRHRPTASGVWAAFEMPIDVPVGTPIRARVRAVSGDAVSAWSEEATGARPLASFQITPLFNVTGWEVPLRIEGWVSALAAEDPTLVLATGDQPIAAMGPLPRGVLLLGSYDWDTSDYPMGTHVWSLRRADGSPSPDLYATGSPLVVERKLRLEWDVSPNGGVIEVGDGGVTFRASVSPSAPVRPPTLVRIWAGPHLVGELTGPPPWAAVTWNTAGIPEGNYPIRAEVPNYLPDDPGQDGRTSWTPFDVLVDRTPPRVTCTPAALGGATGWKQGKVTVQASEAVGGSMELLVNGKAYWPTFWSVTLSDPPRWEFSLDVQEVPPLRVEVSRSWYTDLAGNPAVVDCAFDVPAWLAPLGEGPVAAGGDPIVASSIDLGFQLLDPSRPRVVAAWKGAGGAQDGRLYASTSNAGALSAPQGISTGGRAVSSISVAFWPSTPLGFDERVWVAWTEEGAGPLGSPALAEWNGSGWSRQSMPGFASSTGSARDLAVRTVLTYDQSDAEAAFAEEVSPGTWTVSGRRRRGGSWLPLGGDLGIPAGANVGSLAFAASPGTVWYVGYPSFLAGFIVTSPGGVPQIHVAEAFEAGWKPYLVAGNLDPAVPASEPTVVVDSEMAVAWVEGGKVVARATNIRRDYGDTGFGPASVLNRDPTRRARSPRGTRGVGGYVFPHVIYFVEEGPVGDEIWARRWNGTDWELLPGPLNAGMPGTVRHLSTRDDAVTWIDGDGHVYVRLMNR